MSDCDISKVTYHFSVVTVTVITDPAHKAIVQMTMMTYDVLSEPQRLEVPHECYQDPVVCPYPRQPPLQRRCKYNGNQV